MGQRSDPLETTTVSGIVYRGICCCRGGLGVGKEGDYKMKSVKTFHFCPNFKHNSEGSQRMHIFNIVPKIPMRDLRHCVDLPLDRRRLPPVVSTQGCPDPF